MQQASPPPGPSAKQDQPQRQRSLRREVELALVNVTVLDPADRFVTDLVKEDFRIFDNEVEQEALYLSTEQVPVSVGVIFDVSGSMRGYVESARLAAVQFLKAANPQDEIFLVLFNGRAHLLTDFTHDIREVESRLMWAETGGLTAMYDGIYLGLNQMTKAKNTRRALFVITDGEENHSRYNARDVQRILRESDVQIYAIGAGSSNYLMVNELAERSGGRAFGYADSADIAEKVSQELRSQYVLAYRPSDSNPDGRWHKVKVKVRSRPGLPLLSVFARSGYYAPKR